MFGIYFRYVTAREREAATIVEEQNGEISQEVVNSRDGRPTRDRMRRRSRSSSQCERNLRLTNEQKNEIADWQIEQSQEEIQRLRKESEKEIDVFRVWT